MLISILVKDLNVNGGNRAAFDLSEYLIRAGHDVHIITGQDVKERIKWHSTKAKMIKIDNAKKLHYDSVICTYYTELSSLITLSSNCKIQYIQANYPDRVKEGHERYQQVWSYIKMPGVKRVFVSSYLMQEYSKLGIKGEVIRPAIDHELFFRDSSVGSNNRRILIEGNLDPLKRVVESYLSVPTGYEVWGLGPVDHNMPNNKMLVLPSQQQLRKIYSECSFLLKLSVKEGHPLSILEAMKCGCIPIVSNDGGHKDYCVNDVNCFMIEDGESTRELFYSITCMSSDKLKTMKEKCFETAILYQWNNTATKFLNLIKKIGYENN